MRREKSGHELIADIEKLWYPSLPLANIQKLKIGELEPDSYSSDEELEYVSLDKLIDEIRVLAARINESQPAKKSSKEPVKQRLRRRIKKKKEYAAPKNVQFGEWESVRESLIPAPLLAIHSIAPETTMPNADMGIVKKKCWEKEISTSYECLERVCRSYNHHKADLKSRSKPYSWQATSICIGDWEIAHKSHF